MNSKAQFSIFCEKKFVSNLLRWKIHLNDVDNVLNKETKVLEELQANRFKEKKYYEIVDGDCKCSNWNPLSKCGDNSECKPDAQYKNPCKNTCICEEDLANPECRCAKEAVHPLFN